MGRKRGAYVPPGVKPWPLQPAYATFKKHWLKIVGTLIGCRAAYKIWCPIGCLNYNILTKRINAGNRAERGVVWRVYAAYKAAGYPTVGNRSNTAARRRSKPVADQLVAALS